MSQLYLDCNATTPIEPQVIDIINYYNSIEYANAGSRTHEMGAKAKTAVELSRNQVASILKCESDEIIFTSGATESNNLAILGLKKYANSIGKRHIITTSIEHKAVLEPLFELEKEGFKVTYLPVDNNGVIAIQDLMNAYDDDTFLVSVMHANNETGVIQPIDEIASFMQDKNAYFHIDAAQTFGKILNSLQNSRIDPSLHIRFMVLKVWVL
jgi:cysteine desulfurase